MPLPFEGNSTVHTVKFCSDKRSSLAGALLVLASATLWLGCASHRVHCLAICLETCNITSPTGVGIACAEVMLHVVSNFRHVSQLLGFASGFSNNLFFKFYTLLQFLGTAHV